MLFSLAAHSQIVKRAAFRLYTRHVSMASDRPQESLTTETQRLIAQRLSIGAATIALVLVLSWIVEHLAHPDRNAASTVSVGLELLTLAVTVLVLRRPALWAYSRPLGVAAIAVFMVQVAAYQVAVGEGDVLNVVLLYLVAGTMALVPWGWQGQLPVALMAVGTYVAAIALGVHTATPITVNFLGLAAFCALTVGAAAFLARQRRAAWEQAEALRAANTALEAAGRTKNQFIATVSHELRTPVSVILGYTDLLVDGEFGELPGEARGVLTRIARNGRNLVYLISDLVDLARIEAGRLAVKREPVDLAPVFTEVADFATSRLEGKPIRFAADSADALQVVADRERLEQVLVNLLSNAAKFTERGEIHLRARPGDGDTVVIEVSDTGPGIDPGDLAQIFQPFEQGGAGKKRGGVGMGLYLSASLARAMGGELSVDSEVGRGSTFVLRLPCSGTAVAPPPCVTSEPRWPTTALQPDGCPTLRRRLWAGVSPPSTGQRDPSSSTRRMCTTRNAAPICSNACSAARKCASCALRSPSNSASAARSSVANATKFGART